MSGASPSLVALLLLVSCATSPIDPRTVRLDAEFTLAPGQTAQVEGGGLRVTFYGVSADSRCPTGVTCVWEGDAALGSCPAGRAGQAFEGGFVIFGSPA